MFCYIFWIINNVGVILPASSCAWQLPSGSLGTPSRVSWLFCPPISLVSNMLWVIVPVIKLLAFKIFPTSILFSYPNHCSSPTFLKILESHCWNPFYLPSLRSTLRFFCPISLVLSPISDGPANFRSSWISKNSRPPYYRHRDGRITKRGFFFGVIF